MFGFFKKRIHESLALQAQDVVEQSPLIARIILQGINCDKLPKGKGEFGTITNPIPVNSAIGEIKYLAKLRGKTGYPLFFHRIASLHSEVCEHSLDVYEVVCVDGTQWNDLYFDMYHPRRSNIAPTGYTLKPLDKKLKFDIPIGFGVNGHLHNFPLDIPSAIIDLYGSKVFAKKADGFLAANDFKRKK